MKMILNFHMFCTLVYLRIVCFSSSPIVKSFEFLKALYKFRIIISIIIIIIIITLFSWPAIARGIIPDVTFDLPHGTDCKQVGEPCHIIHSSETPH